MAVISKNKLVIEIEELIHYGLDNYTIVDVRAPCEFINDNIPNSTNVPILDDKEREIVGIIYKNEGPSNAKIKALNLIHTRLPDILENIIDISKNKSELIIYCARGGARSEVTQTLLSLLQVRSLRISGGYKAFRGKICSYFTHSKLPLCITLYGPTGSGKTLILNNLYKAGYNTIDLERCAAHKGSNFGYIGENDFNSITQKKFETLLWYRLYHQKFPAVTFIEGESKKVGKVVIPERLFLNMSKGIKIYMNMPLKKRIEFIINEYKPYIYKDEIISAFKSIEKYIGKIKSTLLLKLLDENRFDEFVELILKIYYDPLYRHSFPENFDYMLTYNSVEEAQDKLQDIYYRIC
jgi:tRNA 2-selenouridine synthase